MLADTPDERRACERVVHGGQHQRECGDDAWLRGEGGRLQHAPDRIPVAWVSAEAQPYYTRNGVVGKHTAAWASGYACPPGDFRTMHVLNAYNRIAQEATARHGLDYIDTWPMTSALNELAFDGTHFLDPVSLHIALRVLDWLAGRLQLAAVSI